MNTVPSRRLSTAGILKYIRNTKMVTMQFTRRVPLSAGILCPATGQLVPDSSEQNGGSHPELSNVQSRMPEQLNKGSIQR
jgi:hypothetical protein